jgi:uncharacterized protein (DUF885 family)
MAAAGRFRTLYGAPRAVVLEVFLRALRREDAASTRALLARATQSVQQSQTIQREDFRRLAAVTNGGKSERRTSSAQGGGDDTSPAVILAEAERMAGAVLGDDDDAETEGRGGNNTDDGDIFLTPAELFDRAYAARVLLDPEELTNSGILDAAGFRQHGRFLSSPHGADARARDARVRRGLLDLVRSHAQAADRLDAWRDAGTSAAQSLAVLEWELKQAVQRDTEFPDHDFAITQLSGVPSDILLFLSDIHPLESPEDAESYVRRLACVPRRLDEAIEFVQTKQLPRDIVPPAFVLPTVLKACDGVLAAGPRGPLFQRLADAGHAGQDLLSEAEGVMKDAVLPAFRRLREFVDKDMMERATGLKAGVGNLPEGDQFYAWALRNETTTSLTPSQVHELGLEQVSLVESKMRKVLEEKLGRSGSDAEPIAFLRHLDTQKENEAYFYPNSEGGRQDLLKDFRSMVTEVTELISPAFDLQPRTPMEVRPMPESLQDGAPGAMYMPPADDGSRPGIFYVNTGDMGSLQKFGMRTLVAHEAIPGHHFQLALQYESEDLPWFRRRSCFYNAYIEGWALYAERLCLDLGYYTSPFDELGHYGDELLRAMRLVVDPAIHALGWDRSKARAYMLEHTTLPEAEVDSELDRYFVLPGQACGYKVGQLRLLELRDASSASEGPALVQWHRRILETGAVPLDLLE